MKSRILFIVQLPPPVHGASLMNEFAVGSKLINEAYQCEVLPLQFASSISDIGSFSFRKIWLTFVFCGRLIAKLITFRPQLTYFTFAPVGGAFFRDAFFTMIIKLFGKKLVLHLHGKGISKAAAGSVLKKFLYRISFKNTRIIVLAPVLENDIRSVFNGKVFFLSNGIPSLEANRGEKSNQVPVILYLSNLIRSKGIYLFLECLQTLQRNQVDFKAIIIGAEGDVSISEVKDFIMNNGLGKKTEVMGPLYGEEKQRVMLRSDMLVFPSFYENEAFPLTILEAMRAGMTVIASNNGAIPEIVDNGVTGYVVPIREVDEMTRKIKFLCENETTLKKMGIAAREKFGQCYTIEKFEQGLFEIFKDILN